MEMRGGYRLRTVLLGAVALVFSASAYGQVVINEIMQNPSAVGDSNGEWLELHNTTGAAIDIDGWTIEDAGSNSHVIGNANGTTLIPAGGFLVLGVNADTVTNGGAPVDYQYNGFTLANGDDEVILLDLALAEVDRVEYDGGPNFPDPNGASMALRDPGLDNNVAANWCESAIATYGDGDFGTPGAANDCPSAGACCQGGMCTDDLSPAECEGPNGGIFQGPGTDCSIMCPAPSGAVVRITEFQHDGADGEFIEFTNLDVVAVDMTGWSFDNDSNTPGTVDLSGFGTVNPGESVILTDVDALAFDAAWGLGGTVVIIGNLSANLSSGGDTINLYDASATLVDTLAYAADSADGVSRWPCEDVIGLDDFSGWISSQIGDVQGSYASTGGDTGNPGSFAQDPCPTVVFGACCYAGFCAGNVSDEDCALGGGTFQGEGTDCTVACPAGPAVTINEIRIDQPGGDDDEYFELCGPAGASLDGLWYVTIGDSAVASGSVESAVSLTGLTVPADGFFLAVEDTFTLGGSPDVTYSSNELNFENSDNVTHLLVAGFTGAIGDDLDTNRDCTLDVTPWAGELDRIALVEEENPPVGTECHYGPPQIGPDGSFVPGHVFRCDDCTGDWNIGAFDPVGGNDTPGEPNGCLGACCAAGFCAEGLTAENCANAGGAFQGLGSDCSGSCPAGPAVTINEIRIDQPGGDDDEYFELCGPAAASLDGLWYVVIGDSAVASGSLEAAIPLSGQVVPADGFFVAAESTFTLGVADLTTTLDFENSDNVTHLLVAGFTGAIGDDLDVDDDCSLDSMPWFGELDRIALVEEENPPAGTECHYGPPQIGPDGSFVPGHVFRCEDCTGAWLIGAFDEDGGNDTPGEPNSCATGACCDGDSCTEGFASACDAIGGTYLGDDTTCEGDADGDLVDGECGDACPNDPDKTAEGICGCGTADTDNDNDGVADCNDGCPNDPNKTEPGACGCGNADTDSDGDNVPDCNDGCPNDPLKSSPGACGCGVQGEGDSDGDGIADCNDVCRGLDDTIDENGDGEPDCLTSPTVPTVSTWGLVALALLLLVSGKLMVSNRRLAMN